MTTIRLQNTKSRRREEFTPIDPEDVRMYLCGPTVYDRAHLGNSRNVLLFDVLFRMLRHIYGKDHVRYVRNFTDVDDKINARAAETGRDIGDVTTETIGWYHDDMDALGALRPTDEPRATDYIAQMVTMIADLIDKGHAYAAEGHVLFAVESYSDYGTLSGRAIDDMIAGARVEVAPYKRNPMDFVLWKPSGDGQPGWQSPWGYGRPGWHIECSAMAYELLGETFDIHGGGIDLQFPHHENEIAQSACAHPHGEFARFWVHNEMLMVEGKKMSKSLGNFFTIRDLLDQGIPGEVIRMVMLGTHYGKPMNWTKAQAEEADATLRKWGEMCVGHDPNPRVPISVVDALADDLNTPLAISELHRLARENQIGALFAGARFLGLLQDVETGLVDAIKNVLTEQLMKKLLARRNEARLSKDYPKADQLRQGFEQAGIRVTDTKSGPVWEIERGVLDTAPFHQKFKAALKSGDQDKIDQARSEAKAAGISFASERDSEVVIAWVSKPTSAFVENALTKLESET